MDVKQRILIVEDENIVGEYLRLCVTKLGYAPTAVVPTGDAALLEAETNPPDIILMDIKLRGVMDGVETASIIRQRFDIPVVYLTAYADEATLQRAKITEPFGYVLKPFKEGELRSAIELAMYKHQAERRLKESERRISTILKSIGDAVIVADADNRITYLNPLAEQFTGWSAADAAGHPLDDVLIRERKKDPYGFLGGKSIFFREFSSNSILSGRDGRKIPVSEKVSAITGERGEVSGKVYVLRDISPDVEAESALLEAEAKQRAILEGFEGFVCICSRDGRIEYMNDSLIARTGRDATGEFCYTALHNLQEACPWCVNDRVFAGETVTWEICSPMDRRWYHIISSPMSHPDGSVSNLSMIIDITNRKKMEDELARSNYQMTQILESVGEGIVEIDGERRIVFANRAAEEMLGRSVEEMRGVSFHDVVHGRDGRAQCRDCVLLNGSSSGKALEETFFNRSGRSMQVEYLCSPIREKEREVGAVLVFRDVTERKKAEEAVAGIARGVSAEIGEKFFRSLVTYLAEALQADAVVVGRLIPPEKTLLETIAVYRDGVIEPNATFNCPQTGAGGFGGGEEIFSCLQLKGLFPEEERNHGRESYVGAPLLDAGGAPTGILTVFWRKPLAQQGLPQSMLKIFAVRAAAELERLNAEQRLEAASAAIEERSNFIESVVMNIQSGLIVLDRNYFVRLVNPHASGILRLSGSCIGLSLSDCCRELAVAVESEPQEEISCTSIPGEPIIGYRISPMHGENGEVTGFILSFLDLTEIVKIRKAMRGRERLAAMGEVVARVAHEMRNPLFGITAAAQILDMELPLVPEHKELMNSLLAEARRLNNLVEELLDCSKEIKLIRRRFLLHQLLEEALNLGRGFLEARQIVVERRFGENIEVDGDAEKLHQVLLNLLKNAADASSPGGMVVLETEMRDASLAIRVIDGGKGIAPEHFDRIFDVFYTTKKHGTGLGLYISRRIAEAHGGTLTAANTSAGGAVFTLELPLGSPR